jgi:transposase
VRDLDAAARHIYLEFEYRRVWCPRCKAVKQERLIWLADSSRFTQRLEDKIGRQCRDMAIKQVAENNGLSWDQVRRIEMAYMRRLLAANPIPDKVRAIGVDEVSIHKGQSYVIVVADLEQQRPIWIGEEGRKEDDFKPFFKALGRRRCRGIELAVMDMWKPFRNVTRERAPKARIVFDKFHILRHLSNALDQVRREEYKRVAGEDRDYIKGQRYTLLSHKASLDVDGRRALRMLLKANKRLNKAYILKESFEQAGAVPEVRADDRAALGGHRELLPPREQSVVGFYGRAEQQDTGDTAAGLRDQRPEVSAPQGHHFVPKRALNHAQQTRKSQKTYFGGGRRRGHGQRCQPFPGLTRL